MAVIKSFQKEKKNKSTNSIEDEGKWKTINTAGANYTATREISMDVPQKPNLEPPYGPVMLHLGLYQK